MPSWKRREGSFLISGAGGFRIGEMRALNRRSEIEVKHLKAVRVTRTPYEYGVPDRGIDLCQMSCTIRLGWGFQCPVQ
jgi:hypothetical protein